MRYARVEDNKIVEYRDFADGEIPAHKAHLWKIVEEILPIYNPFYQISFGPEVVIEEDKVRFVYTVEDKDPVELKYLVKAEAQNRILSKYPLWKQNNLLISKVELVAKATLTQEEQAALDDINSQLQEIDKLRVCSDVLEAMSPIPEDYRDNKYWQVA